MCTFWQKGGRILIGLLFILNFSILALPSFVSAAKAAPAGPVPFKASYYNNMTLSGSPALERLDTNINFNWSYGSPAPNINSDKFSARWTRTAYYNDGEQGWYNFYVRADDGVRLYIDSKPVINQWKDQSATTYSALMYLNAPAQHTITMQYYENQGFAVALMHWQKLDEPGAFTGYYYNNSTFTGKPLVRYDARLDFDWGYGSPAPNIPVDNFSARWAATVYIPKGQYLFTVTADDGVRLYLDNKLIINKWKDQPATRYTSIKWINTGAHMISMEYYEHSGVAVAKLNWRPVPGNGGFVGAYYDNQNLSGTPTQMRIDPTVNFNWGHGTPNYTIPADHFSARWTKNVNINEDASYKFTVTVDDGVRLFIDGAPIIDHWQDQPPTQYSRILWLTRGTHNITMEYYENTGIATATLNYLRISS